MAGRIGELRPRTQQGFGICSLALFLSRTKHMSHHATAVTDDDLPRTACFSVHARAEPGIMPRVLELFAKRGLVPSAWHSLTTDIQMRGLSRDVMDYIAACLRQITFVEVVLTSETA